MNNQSINRKQKDNLNAASGPPAYDPIIVEESNITQNDLRELLRSSKRTGNFVCLVAEKREMLGNILKQRHHITAALKNVDALNVREQTDSIFNTRFESCTAIYDTAIKINRGTNTALSDHMIELFAIFKEVINHPKFRSTSKYVLVLMTKMDDAVAFLVAKKEDGKEANALLRGEKRSSQQLDRKYLGGGGTLPRDECLMICAYCQHSTVDEPPENANVATVNQDRLLKHAEIVETWNKYKDGKGPCPKTVSGKLYTRVPPPPKTESLLLQCHCHQMSCSRKGSNVGSTCLIGCMKVDGERYDWSEGMCTCRVCSCPCKKSYAMSNITKIGIELTRVKTASDNGTGSESREIVEQARAKNWLAGCMLQGARVVQATRETLENMNKSGMCKHLLFTFNTQVNPLMAANQV